MYLITKVMHLKGEFLKKHTIFSNELAYIMNFEAEQRNTLRRAHWENLYVTLETPI